MGMSREEAKEKYHTLENGNTFNGSFIDKEDYDLLVDEIYDDFESRICENCKYAEEFDKPKFKYPMAFMSKRSKDLIVLFDGIRSGKVISENPSYNIGDTSTNWTEHTDTDAWQQIPYDKERGFHHGQMVYCWDGIHTHLVCIKFYDAINKCTFDHDGELEGTRYTNYSATMPEFINKAYDTLEGINDEYKG